MESCFALVEHLPEVDDQLLGGPRAVGQFELFELAELDEVGQTRGGQLRTAWVKGNRRIITPATQHNES